MDKLTELANQIETLERRLIKVENQLKNPATFTEKFGRSDQTELPYVAHKEDTNIFKPSLFHQFLTWLKTDWLLKLGGFLLILGLGWFVNYAFQENWIGPIGRISLGIVAGSAILALGHFLVRKKSIAGQTLIAVGATIILVTIYAARSVYGFFTPLSALIIISAVVAATASLSILHRSLPLAILSLLGGGIAPLLTNSPTPNHLSFLTYIFLVDLGAMVVTAFRGWRVLFVLSLLITLIASNAFNDISNNWQTTFIALFYLLFFSANVIAIFYTQTARKSDLLTIALNTIAMIYWINEYISRSWQSSALAVTALLSIGSSYFLFRKRDLFQKPLLIQSASAAVLIGAAFAAELEGTTLLIAFSIEAFLVTLIANKVLKDHRATLIGSCSQAIPLLLFLTEETFAYYKWENIPFFHENFFATLIMAISLLGTTLILKISQQKIITTVHEIATWIFGLLLIWLSVANLVVDENNERSISLVIFAMIGVGLYFYGIRAFKPRARISAGILLGAVVLRLLFIEIWEMSLVGRVVTFIVIGILLISTAFFERHLKEPS